LLLADAASSFSADFEHPDKTKTVTRNKDAAFLLVVIGT